MHVHRCILILNCFTVCLLHIIFIQQNFWGLLFVFVHKRTIYVHFQNAEHFFKSLLGAKSHDSSQFLSLKNKPLSLSSPVSSLFLTYRQLLMILLWQVDSLTRPDHFFSLYRWAERKKVWFSSNPIIFLTHPETASQQYTHYT